MAPPAFAGATGLTMTEIYNLRDWVRAGRPADSPSPRSRSARVALSPAGRGKEERAVQARAGIVDRLHAQIDRAVARAYGWPEALTASEIVARLVALNAERAAEERAGRVRWLRPDYQAGDTAN